MTCPQCNSELPEGEWNCPSCRINVYWASQHYDELASIRESRGLAESPSTPAFLISAHRRAMEERAEQGGGEASKVRQIARDAMRRRS